MRPMTALAAALLLVIPGVPCILRAQTDYQRPSSDGTERWQDQYDKLTPDQKQNASIGYYDKNGNQIRDNRPDIYEDPQVITMRNALGNRIRLIAPPKLEWVDVKPILDQQQEALDLGAQQLKQRQDLLNGVRKQKGQDFFAAKDEEREARTALDDLNQQQRDLDAKWSLSRYSYCPENNSWGNCNHSDLKQKWQQNKQAEQDQLDRQFDIVNRRINAAVQKGSQAYSDLQQAKQRGDSLVNDVGSYKGIVERQNSGDLWLYPGGKSPLSLPGSPSSGSTLIFDDNAPGKGNTNKP